MATAQERRVVTRAIDVRTGRAEGEPARLSGYAAVFGQEAVIAGCFREVIAPGAFVGAIGRDDVRALWNHDPNYVLGRRGAGTLRLSEDATGLRYEIDPPNTQWARDLLVTIERGDVSGSSFGFTVTDQEWDFRDLATGGLALRTVRAVTLDDVSPVTYPAYAETTAEVRAQAAGGETVLIATDTGATIGGRDLLGLAAAMAATMIRRKRQALIDVTY